MTRWSRCVRDGEVEDAESGAEAGRTRLLRLSSRAHPRTRTGRTPGILYGLRSCLKSRSPDVDGKREPWDAGSARKNQPHTRVLSVGQPRVRDPLLAGEILGSDTCLLTRRPTVKRSNVDSPNERLGSTIGSASDSSSEGCEFDSCLGQFLHTNYSYGTFVLYIS